MAAEVTTAPAPQPILDPHTAQMLLALKQQYETPPMHYDPYAGEASAAPAPVASASLPGSDIGVPAYALGGGGMRQPSALRAHDLYTASKRPRAEGSPALDVPGIKYPTLAEIIKAAALQLNPSVQTAKDRMVQALAKTKGIGVIPKVKGAASITPPDLHGANKG